MQLGSPVDEGEVAVVPPAAGLLERDGVDRVAYAVGGDHLQRPREPVGVELLEAAVRHDRDHRVRPELRGRDRGGRRHRQRRTCVVVRQAGARGRHGERQSQQGGRDCSGGGG